MCLRGLRVNVKGVAFGKLTLADDKPGDRSATEEDPISLLPDVLFCGMAFVDLAHLRKEDIKEGILSYYRQKSGSLIQVEIPAEAQGLLNELAADTTEDSPYLFPFLEGMKTGEDAYKEYNTVLGGFNRRLKILSESIGIHTRVTSYTIRHSFATTLKEQNVPIEMISELLGHKSIKTTQIYLKSFSLEKLSTVKQTLFRECV